MVLCWRVQKLNDWKGCGFGLNLASAVYRVNFVSDVSCDLCHACPSSQRGRGRDRQTDRGIDREQGRLLDIH